MQSGAELCRGLFAIRKDMIISAHKYYNSFFARNLLHGETFADNGYSYVLFEGVIVQCGMRITSGKFMWVGLLAINMIVIALRMLFTIHRYGVMTKPNKAKENASFQFHGFIVWNSKKKHIAF